ncbi:Arm DNA-binding domain-containing protein [Asticcacaulis sp. AND118]|uniref:Arm DNA-binding domain-containing protein n=1 Tax=Asticcacaulis sp. AND118 TaxID=2840468 RepID=UPI001CFF8A0D|nr:Arm DNA-binding domain-containing protein [Asticcacaulis sp. AND118]
MDSLSQPGKYSDGNNLYLHVSRTGAKSWIFNYRWRQFRKEMGLGPYPAISLSDARQAALGALRMLKDRDTPQDPIALRRQRQKIEVAKPTFAVYSERLLSDIES